MTFSEEQKKKNDEFFMKRCLRLAENGLYTTAPNPLVGSVITHHGKIIGEGYHIRPGEGHAEVNAVRSVLDEKMIQESTLYVNLEPCSHQGRTPSCADLIIKKGIKRVVIGCKDPFKKVNGNGIQKLQEAGIETTVGILEKECMELNRRFMTFHSQKRPYIILKWAESADGFIDKRRESGSPQIFSTPHTSLYTHKLRAETEAILVGRRTALLDNPSLTVRHWIGENPVRLVIDKKDTLPSTLSLFDHAVRTIVFSENEALSSEKKTYSRIEFTHKQVPEEILRKLHEQDIQSVLIEGGSYTLHAFIEAGLWDEAYVEKSPICLNDGIAAPSIQGIEDFFIRFGRFFKTYQNPKAGKTIL